MNLKHTPGYWPVMAIVWAILALNGSKVLGVLAVLAVMHIFLTESSTAYRGWMSKPLLASKADRPL